MSGETTTTVTTPAPGTAPAGDGAKAPAPETKPAEGNQKTSLLGEGSKGEPGAQDTGEKQTQEGAKPGDGGDKALADKLAAFEVKLPEGFEPDVETLKTFKTTAIEAGIKPEQAQKFLELHATVLRAVEKKSVERMEAQEKAWVESVKADKEIGGADFKKNLATAGRAVRLFGGDPLRKLLDETGLGNHPELVRAFFRAGKAIAEDTVAGSIGGGGPKVDPLQEMYPNSPQMFERR